MKNRNYQRYIFNNLIAEEFNNIKNYYKMQKKYVWIELIIKIDYPKLI